MIPSVARFPTRFNPESLGPEGPLSMLYVGARLGLCRSRLFFLEV